MGWHTSATFTALREASLSQVRLGHAGCVAFGGLSPQPEQSSGQVSCCSQDPQIRTLGSLLVSPLSQFIPVPSAICHSTIAFPWRGRQQSGSHALHLCKVLWLRSTACLVTCGISLAMQQEHLSRRWYYAGAGASFCGGRKSLHMRPVGTTAGERLCQHLWESCQPVPLPPFPLLDYYHLCVTFLYSFLPSYVCGAEGTSSSGVFQEGGFVCLSLPPMGGWSRGKGLFFQDQAEWTLGPLGCLCSNADVHLRVVFIPCYSSQRCQMERHGSERRWKQTLPRQESSGTCCLASSDLLPNSFSAPFLSLIHRYLSD